MWSQEIADNQSSAVRIGFYNKHTLAQLSTPCILHVLNASLTDGRRSRRLTLRLLQAALCSSRGTRHRRLRGLWRRDIGLTTARHTTQTTRHRIV